MRGSVTITADVSKNVFRVLSPSRPKHIIVVGWCRGILGIVVSEMPELRRKPTDLGGIVSGMDVNFDLPGHGRESNLEGSPHMVESSS